MKIGILITARLGSTRLKGKHLLPANGRPLIHYLVKRIQGKFESELRTGAAQLIIATSDEPENRAFEMFVADGVSVYYGSKNNIPHRHLQAAQTHSLEAIVSIDGDDILCSVQGVRSLYEKLQQGAAYVRTTKLPFGMNTIGYSRLFLESSMRGHTDQILETGWGHIFDPGQLHDVEFFLAVDKSDLRFTLDYPEDYQFFTAVIESLGDSVYDASDQTIVNTVVEKKLYAINDAVAKQYWENFYRLQEQEKKK